MVRELRALPAIAISVVSHGQGALVEPLLAQLGELARTQPMEVVLTENIPYGRAALSANQRAEMTIIENPFPLGFGANHNQAFRHTTAPFFFVLNPDVKITGSVFEELVACLMRYPGVAGPRVLSPEGSVEDSARKVPNIWRLLIRKVVGITEPDYDASLPVQGVDWLAGMCLGFDRESFECVAGFDERYHLYCEDVDIGLRMHLAGRCVSWVQAGVVQHDARRHSHRSPRYLAWHLTSFGRLFCSSAYWRFSRRSSPVVSRGARNPHV